MTRPIYAESQNTLVLQTVATHLVTPEPFTLADLIAAVWTDHPERFALAGYPDLPDGHKVRCCLGGPRGLVTLDYLERVGPSRFRLTERGRSKARGEAEQSPLVPAEVRRALQTIAPKLYRLNSGASSAVEVYDAAEFWGAGGREAFRRVLEAAEPGPEVALARAVHYWLDSRFPERKAVRA